MFPRMSKRQGAETQLYMKEGQGLTGVPGCLFLHTLRLFPPVSSGCSVPTPGPWSWC